MNEQPYGVLNAGEWSLWCRACLWRSLSRQADPLSFKASLREAEAEWRAHSCVQGSGAPAPPLPALDRARDHRHGAGPARLPGRRCLGLDDQLRGGDAETGCLRQHRPGALSIRITWLPVWEGQRARPVSQNDGLHGKE